VGWEDLATVLRRVRETANGNGTVFPQRPPPQRPAPQRPAPQQTRPAPGSGGPAPDGPARPRPNDPGLWPQREAIKLAMQVPALAGPVYDSLPAGAFTEPAYLELHKAILGAGGTTAGLAGSEWLAAVAGRCQQPVVRSLLTELAVEPLNARQSDEPRYAGAVLARLQETVVVREIAQAKSKLQRLSPVDDADSYHQLFGDLVALEQFRKGLREQAMGAL
ncbi:MAG TPA: DNA primase, partial [Pseudonocardiaceae bacterium]|nr:DNA primase [Pseudonocardiaceae bacterium]